MKIFDIHFEEAVPTPEGGEEKIGVKKRGDAEESYPKKGGKGKSGAVKRESRGGTTGVAVTQRNKASTENAKKRRMNREKGSAPRKKVSGALLGLVYFDKGRT